MKSVRFVLIFLMIVLAVSIYSIYGTMNEAHKFSVGECRICHAEENKSFKTLRTVESSKCMTCHEEETQSHPYDVVPTTTIPEDMPLIGGRMSCITCHYAHPFSVINKKFSYSLLRKPGKGAMFCGSCHKIDDKGHIVYTIAHKGSYRETNGRVSGKNNRLDLLSIQCIECHDKYLTKPIRSLGLGLWSHNRTDLQHPVGVSYASIASRKPGSFNPLSSLSAMVRLFDGKIGCGTCHDPASKEDFLLAADNKNGKLCLECHRL
jgi:predicted CXXCH cytochrome family protein